MSKIKNKWFVYDKYDSLIKESYGLIVYMILLFEYI